MPRFPELFLLINPFQLEDDRTCTVVAARYHYLFVIRPAAHNRTALQSGVNITADAVPRLGTERAVQHTEIIVTVHDNLLSLTEERARPRFRVCQILALQVLITLPFQDRNLTLVFHLLVTIIHYTIRFWGGVKQL